MKEKLGYNRLLAIGISVVVAIVAFLIIYGPYSLDVTNDAWIMKGYDGTDIVQHYAGWTQYRNSDWHMPLGYAEDMAYGDGTYITYTDSIPYVAIFFKIFRNFLPETFQYFGWFTFACFILQGIAACLLIERRCKNYVAIVAGEILFLTNPVLIERTFKHTALGAQWLILLALYYYLEFRSGNKKKLPWQLCFLSMLTIGIHPYFLPMVMIFVLLVIIDALLKKYRLWRIGLFMLGSVSAPLVAGYFIGAIGSGVKNTRGGYGLFGMNLNSLFNPRSYGGFMWSQVLPWRGQILHNYDGFNYLGLGIIGLVIICVVVALYKTIRFSESRKSAGMLLKENIPLMLCMLFMTLFAISTTVTFDENIILEITIPKKLSELCDLFRASGRMFYPVYYLIYISVIYFAYNIRREIFGAALVTLTMVTQLADMRDVFWVKYETMKEGYYAETIFDDEFLQEVPEKEVLVTIGTIDPDLQRSLAIWAAKHNMATAYSVANSGKYLASKEYTNVLADEVLNGTLFPNVMYVTEDETVLAQWHEALAGREYVEYKRGFYYFIYTE